MYAIEKDEAFINQLSEKMKAIYLLGKSTGLRISDIIELKKEILKIKEPTIKEKKTGKSKRIYIKKNIREMLINIAKRSPNNYIFGSKSKSGHISRQAVYKEFKKAAKKTGIKTNIGTHSMRKKYAINIKKNHNLKYVQNKLNHENIADSILYLYKEENNK